jgi:hypothetical protein
LIQPIGEVVLDWLDGSAKHGNQFALLGFALEDDGAG